MVTATTIPRFPARIKKRVKGSQWGFVTDIASPKTGVEVRNIRQTRPKGRWIVELDVQPVLRRDSSSDIETVRTLFAACSGRKYAFGFKDWSEYTTSNSYTAVTGTDQTIGTGDGATAAFPLSKTHKVSSGTSNERSITRLITLPVASTVIVTVDSSVKTEDSHYTVNYDTGIVTFTMGNIPAAAAVIKAGCQYDILCRFDVDILELETHFAPRTSDGGQQALPPIPIVETFSLT